MHRTHNQQLNNCTCVFAVINDAAEPDGDEARAEKPQVNESVKQESNYVDGVGKQKSKVPFGNPKLVRRKKSTRKVV
jgi:hypothetical protein